MYQVDSCEVGQPSNDQLGQIGACQSIRQRAIMKPQLFEILIVMFSCYLLSIDRKKCELANHFKRGEFVFGK